MHCPRKLYFIRVFNYIFRKKDDCKPWVDSETSCEVTPIQHRLTDDLFPGIERESPYKFIMGTWNYGVCKHIEVLSKKPGSKIYQTPYRKKRVRHPSPASDSLTWMLMGLTPLGLSNAFDSGNFKQTCYREGHVIPLEGCLHFLQGSIVLYLA